MTGPEAIRKYHQACKGIALLATVEQGQPRLRPMSPVLVEGAVVWMAADAGSPKMAQIAANPSVELCYMDGEHNHLRLRGTAEICGQDDVKRRLWDAYPMMHQYFTSPQNPRYAVIKVTVREALVLESMALGYQSLAM